MRERFNTIKVILIKVLMFFWNISRLKKFLIIVFLIFAVPYCLNIILFYTLYALPADGFIPDSNVIFTFREGDKIYKGHFDKGGEMQRELVGPSDPNDVGQNVFNKMVSTSTNINVSLEGNIIFDLFGMCETHWFLFSPPCYGWFNTALVLENSSTVQNILYGGGIHIFEFNPHNSTYYMNPGLISSNQDNISVFIQKSMNVLVSHEKLDYIYI